MNDDLSDPPRPGIMAWSSISGQAKRAAEAIRTGAADTRPRIPDVPPERTYNCPGCHKGVKATRIGNTSSSVVEHVVKSDCKYKGPVTV